MFKKKKTETKTFVDGKQQQQEPEQVNDYPDMVGEPQEQELQEPVLPMTLVLKIDEVGNIKIARV